ncbi:MAG: methyltransferase domain-containing protein [Chloroflexi bacterium]|nr:methyltransferase domain-containing protein [Chloroflexota bacterium]
MRRIVFLAGAAAVVAGAAVWVSRSRGAASPGSPGVLPGRLGSWVNAYLDRPLHAVVARALDLQPDDALLDVACGGGYFLTESASHVGHVAGLDLSEPRVDLARRRLADRIAAGTAEVVQGEAGALPWEDGRFTTVSCMDAFPFFPEPERALAEMGRVLRPGGRAVIDMNPKVPEGTESHLLRGPAGQVWVWSDADVRRMMETAGFGDVAITYARPGGDNRLGNYAVRQVFGTDEETIVTAVKPMPIRPAEDARAEEPVAVG